MYKKKELHSEAEEVAGEQAAMAVLVASAHFQPEFIRIAGK